MNNKTLAIVAYLTFIGWIIALIMNKDKDELVRFHLRQFLGIAIYLMLGSLLYFIPILSYLIWLTGFVFWVMGIISAANATQRPVPLIGPFIQNLFKGI